MKKKTLQPHKTKMFVVVLPLALDRTWLAGSSSLREPGAPACGSIRAAPARPSGFRQVNFQQ